MKRKLEAILNAETEHADDTFDGADEGADAHMCSKEYDVEKIIFTRYNHVCAFLSLLSTSTNHWQATGEQEWEIKYVDYSKTSWEPIQNLQYGTFVSTR